MADKKLLDKLKVKKTHYIGIPFFPFLVATFLILLFIWASFFPSLIEVVIKFILVLLIFVLPILLLGLFWHYWRIYVRTQFITKQTPVLLELKIPAHILKTPKAMEQVFAGLHVGPGETTFIDRWIKGKVRPWISLELVSIEGHVHMYVWTWKQMQNLIEAQFYSQYPDLEIYEVSDYTQGVYYNKSENTVFAMELSLSKKDAYPIKTYIDLELDREAKKAEQIIDPIASVFEKLSAIGEGEQMWVQIFIRQNKGATTRDVFWFGKSKKWKEEAKEEIEEIYEKAKPKKPGDDDEDGYPLLKPGEINTIKALERSIDKPGFDAGIRALYVAKKDSFNGTRISGFATLFSSFNSGSLNGFVPGGPWHTSLDYPWQNFGDRKGNRYSTEAIDAYKRRSFFHLPYKRPRFVLTSEELATIFHFPSEEVKAPGLERSPSIKREPPANLPV